jgi:GAF domain-containing protein
MVQNDPRVRFYAGALLHGKGGQPIGTLCVIDMRPRAMSDEERGLLADLAMVVETELSRVPAKAETAP